MFKCECGETCVERWTFLVERNRYFKIYHCPKNNFSGKLYRNVRAILAQKIKKGACSTCVFNTEIFDMHTHKRIDREEEEMIANYFFPNIYRVTVR